MKEKNKNKFFDTSSLVRTEGIISRCNAAFIEAGLKERFPDEIISVKKADIVWNGKYGMPPYCASIIAHRTGKHTEKIYVWSPLAWNDRFAGCVGGGTAVGGKQYINRPDNTSRSMTLPKAVLNGFTAAITDGACTKAEWALDKDGNLDRELIENWRARSTHFMTLTGKAVAEILHERPVKYSYLHGGSGGGRQSMVEAQEFPLDYNGIWASCPAINWSKFLPIGLWFAAVTNSCGVNLTPEKMEVFLKAAQDSVGGREAYYEYADFLDFNPMTCVDGKFITEKDAKAAAMLYRGPHDEDGNRLWYAMRAGNKCWNVGLPVGAWWYKPITKKPSVFFLATFYMRWVVENKKQKFGDVTIPEFIELFEKSVSKFGDCLADNPDLSAFRDAGGKLMIDHSFDDPLIPTDGTAHYMRKVIALLGRESVESFTRVYLNPGDGHGSCNWHAPGITDCDGMTALLNWVENDVAPEEIRKVLVDKKGNTVREGVAIPYRKF